MQMGTLMRASLKSVFKIHFINLVINFFVFINAF